MNINMMKPQLNIDDDELIRGGRRKKLTLSTAIINFCFIIYSIMCIGPLLLVLGGSFSSESDVIEYGYSFIPRTFTTGSYEFIFGNGGEIIKAYGITIFVTIVGTSLALIISAALAYPISRKDFKYRNGFAFYIFFTMLFNGGMVPMYLVYTKLIPINNTILALILPNMIGAFNILLMRTFFVQNIPDSVIESAEIDGASTYRIFFTMVLPLSKPVLATVTLFTAMSYWNDFFRNMLFIRDDNFNGLQYLLYRVSTTIQQINNNPQLAMQFKGNLPDETARMAMVIITIGPIIFLYPFLQKYFVKGLVVGAVKG